MATYVKNIKDNSGNIIYPKTRTDAIYNTNNVLLQTSLENSILIVQNKNVPTSSWLQDTTYGNFPYRAAISISGCTANHCPEVVFDADDACSGMFGPIAETYNGGVYIYANNLPQDPIIIPTIKLEKIYA